MTGRAPLRVVREAPPHDLDAEGAVLSAILLVPERLADVQGMLTAAHFYSDANRRIYTAILALARDSLAIDAVTVASWLRAHDHLAAVGGTPYLTQVIHETPEVAHVAEHATIVRDRWIQRHVLATLEVSAAEARTTADVAGLVQRTTESLVAIASGNARSSLERISAADIFAPLPPIQWLIEGLDLCPGAVNLIAGYGFSGKTAAAQAMALAVATGRRVWGTFAARQGRVLHVDYEQGRRLTLERYQRLAAAELLTPDDFADRLSVIALPTLYLDTPGAEDRLVKECEGHALLIIDSLRAAAPSVEENDSSVRVVLDMLSRVSERTGVTVIVLHHARKPVKDAAGGAKMAIRGSGAIFDACASVLVFEAPKGEPVRVSHEKARTSGRTADDFVLRIDDVEIDGHAHAGLSVLAEGAPSASTSGASRVAAAEPTVLAVIQRHPGITSKRLRAECTGIRAALVDSAVESLADSEAIRIENGPNRTHRHYAAEPS